MKDFLAISDFSKEDIQALLDEALRVKAEVKSGKQSTALAGKRLGMLFEKPSTRTRLSFEVGMMQLGGQAIYIRGEEVGMGERESVEDVARVLSRYMDAIMFRSKSHRDMTVFAEYATVPVINGLSDFNHPCQALADMLTILEKKKRLEGIKLVYVGDGNNVCESLMSASDLLGVEMTVVAPDGYAPKLIKSPLVTLTSDFVEGVRGADVVYTDVWTSMGQEDEKKKRLNDFTGYCVTEQVMAIAGPDALFMHCLPAHRGEEVSHGVMESEQSVVFDQAENRMHAQKAVLLRFLNT